MSWIQDGLPEGMGERLGEAVETVREADRVRVLCHYDADGTASAAVLTRALLRENQEVHATLSHVLNQDRLDRATEDALDILLVSDMGSAQVDLLEGVKTPVVVLDHHQPLRDSETVIQLNPHFFGLQGTRDACGATTSFLLAAALDESNLDLAGIALVGCIGDRQHIGGFKGINALLFGRAMERGILRAEPAPALADLPLAEALHYSVGPYFRGLSGREEAIQAFLSELGVDPAGRLREMGPPQRELLLSALSLRLVGQEIRPETVQHLVEEKYWYPPYGVYVDDLESLVNACSRQGAESLGMALSLGDFSGREEAEGLRQKHWTALLRGLHKVEEDGAFAKDHIQFFYADGPTLAGSVAGVSMRYLLDQEKPTLGLAVVNGSTKVSARGTDYLISQGVNLAEALREGAQAVGGSGGGHNIASGATIPKGKEEGFLEVVDSVIGRQRASAEES
ncbi:MAG: DHHA1 domain-containing protein [Thermoplasmata archaeon]